MCTRTVSSRQQVTRSAMKRLYRTIPGWDSKSGTETPITLAKELTRLTYLKQPKSQSVYQNLGSNYSSNRDHYLWQRHGNIVVRKPRSNTGNWQRGLENLRTPCYGHQLTSTDKIYPGVEQQEWNRNTHKSCQGLNNTTSHSVQKLQKLKSISNFTL